MKFEWQGVVTETTEIANFLARNCDVSKSQLKKALAFGGAWLQKSNAKTKKRIRRATAVLAPGDKVWLYFDSKLLSKEIPSASLISEGLTWSCWFKPSDVLSQGSPFGDRGCMIDQLERMTSKPVYLIHRLDREAFGLMLFAHTKKSAANLSQQWREHSVKKHYQAEVLGKLEGEGTINTQLDGKTARTHYQVTKNLSHSSLIAIELETGRFHQIRRHLAELGHPLLGDPLYRSATRPEQSTSMPIQQSLQLCSHQLSFRCPDTQKNMHIELPLALRIF